MTFARLTIGDGENGEEQAGAGRRMIIRGLFCQMEPAEESLQNIGKGGEWGRGGGKGGGSCFCCTVARLRLRLDYSTAISAV